MYGNASMALCVGHAVEKEGTAKDRGTESSRVTSCYLRQRTGLNMEITELFENI